MGTFSFLQPAHPKQCVMLCSFKVNMLLSLSGENQKYQVNKRNKESCFVLAFFITFEST